ncbi:MAG: hypothetical protein K5637_05665 [Lachnospiraceae bacterium]|nr:hypothetical protein [Lachnospiraceae bacterium]
MNKTTGELLAELGGSAGFNRYLHNNQAEFISGEIGSHLERIRQEQKLSKAELSRRSGISDFFSHGK